MISLKQRNQGFTIVELLIVIVVIGILAALVITTYSGIQAKGRDSQRAADVSAMVTQLEAYKSDKGNYPSLAQLNTAAFREAEIKSLDAEAIVDPSSDCNPATATTCLTAATLTATSKQYRYAPVNISGTSCEADALTCVAYTLSAWLEKAEPGEETLTKKNLD